MQPEDLILEKKIKGKLYRFRKWIILITGVFLFIFFLLSWFLNRDVLPKTIRIATSSKSGFYFELATAFAPYLEKQTGRKVEILSTRGSVENRTLILENKAEIAILQADTMPFEGLKSLTPLYEEPVYLVVRKESAINSLNDLKGQPFILGPKGSGMRQSSLRILAHYGLKEDEIKENQGYYTDLEKNPKLEGALITTSLITKRLKDLLQTKKYKIIPIEDTKALSLLNPYLQSFVIPRGVFGERPAIPDKEINTIATTCYLSVKENASENLVESVLESYFESLLRLKYPILLPKDEAKKWILIPRHFTANEYFEPYKGLDRLINFFESIATIKELLFALGALFYLIWNIRMWVREREREKQVRHQKNRLEELLRQTASIERAQMDSESIISLNVYLDKITELKLEALKELTHEDLRGDRLFSIFIMQCTGLISKIQFKINTFSLEKNTKQSKTQSIPKTPPAE